LRKKIIIYLLLVICLILFLVPVYILIITSVKNFSEVTAATMWKFPRVLDFEGFLNAFDKLKGNIMNSLYMTIPATLISALLGSWNGYILTKWKFRGSDVLFTLILFGMFIPSQSILIPLVMVLRSIGLYGSIPGLILTHGIYGIPITTLIYRNYYSTVPDEMVEASKIDGANLFGIYFHIMFKIGLPAFAVASVYQFTSIWNDFLFALVVTQNPSVQPVTVALANLAGNYYVEWNIQMAGALMLTIPPLLVYIFLGRYFVKGLLAGSVKG
jgi:glucose/mannose transport system permease protein